MGAVGQEASYHWGYLAGLVLAVLAVVTATRIVTAPRAGTDTDTAADDAAYRAPVGGDLTPIG